MFWLKIVHVNDHDDLHRWLVTFESKNRLQNYHKFCIFKSQNTARMIAEFGRNFDHFLPGVITIIITTVIITAQNANQIFFDCLTPDPCS